MKTIIRLGLLVALLCAFQPNLASAQVTTVQHPHPQVPAVYFHFFWGANYPISNPTGQGTYISIYTQDGVFTLPAGLTKRELADIMGGPFYVSILIKEGLIEFDENGIWRPGPAVTEMDEEEVAALKKLQPVVGEGG